MVSGRNAPIGYAPMSASRSARRPTIVPSRVAPISTSCTCARPCVSARSPSERDSVHRTGPPNRLEAAATAMYSGYTCSLAPNPPPTSGAIVRTASRSTPSTSARSFRTSNGTWVDTQTVYVPSPWGSTAMPLPSMGTGATRWFTNRARATTSAPSSTSSSQSVENALATFDPCPGHSSGASSCDRGLDVGHGRKRIELDQHGLRCVLRLGEGLRDDERHRLADEPHDVASEDLAPERTFEHTVRRPPRSRSVATARDRSPRP